MPLLGQVVGAIIAPLMRFLSIFGLGASWSRNRANKAALETARDANEKREDVRSLSDDELNARLFDSLK